MKRIAHHVDAIDRPRSDEGNRHIHKKATPKLGGLGIFLAFLVGYMCFGEQSIRMNSILIGSFIVILTGILDDTTFISPPSVKYIIFISASAFVKTLL